MVSLNTVRANRRTFVRFSINMLNDFRYAIRILRQNPGVMILAIVALAIGIGANAAIFSVVNGVLLRPLPYKDPERLVFVRADLQGEIGHAGLAGSEINDIRNESKLVEEIGWMVNPSANLTGGEMEHVTAATASDEFLRVLGVQPAMGRLLSHKEDQGPERVANLLISYELWQRRYNRDPNIIGRGIEVNNFTATIVGVLPERFRVYLGAGAQAPPQIDIWFPADSFADRRYHQCQTIARLRGGVTLEQAQSELDALALRLVQEYPKDYPNGDFRFRLVPLHQDLVKPVRTAILVLLGAVGFVLLIACANIANLMLARASGRQKEIAVRAALGATRLRVIRQLLSESIVLAMFGGALGLLLGRWGVDALLYLRPQNLPRQDDIALDGVVTAFTVAIALISGILSGLAPALHSAKTDFNAALKESGRSHTSGAGSSIRTGLIVAQVALSLILLIGAGLMIRSFANMRSVDLGFDPAEVLTFRVEVSPREYRDFGKRWNFYRQAMEVVQAQPGVEAASGIVGLPMDPAGLNDFYATVENPDAAQNAIFSPVLPGYFRAMRIPLKTGRDFTTQDNDEAAAVAIIDEHSAQRLWPGESAIGKRLYVQARTRSMRQLAEIVGVAGHVQYGGLREDTRPVVYIPYRNLPYIVTMTVRAKTDALSLAASLKKTVEGLGGRRPVWDIRLMSDYVSDAMAETRFALVMLGMMSGVAILLSAIGIYGVVSYSVAARLQEFAIRIALGAQPTDILRLSLAWGVAPAAVGIVIGIVGAIALSRLLSTLLFSVSPTDFTTYAAVSSLLFVVALLACYIPVKLRALRSDLKTSLLR